jgi:predicted dehydrogenase
VCDQDEGKAKESRANVQAEETAEVYTDAAVMLREVKPDLLDIITPPDTHYALVKVRSSSGCSNTALDRRCSTEMQYASQDSLLLSLIISFFLFSSPQLAVEARVPTIICQKPLANTLEEAQQIVALAEEAKVALHAS